LLIPCYLSCRVYASLSLPIQDCDEVFNYWEPLNFLLYDYDDASPDTFSVFLQTWEYSHQYALRTYAYLLPWKYLAQFILRPIVLPWARSFLMDGLQRQLRSVSLLLPTTGHFIQVHDRIIMFQLLKLSMTVITAGCELIFLYSLLVYFSQNAEQRTQQRATAELLLILSVFLLFSTGMMHATTSFLPSSTWLAIWLLCAACYLNQRDHSFVILAVLGTLGTGWPFGCVSVVVPALHILIRQGYRSNSDCFSMAKWLQFVFFICLVAVLAQAAVMRVDFPYYYSDVKSIAEPALSPSSRSYPSWYTFSTTWNIFRYNAGSQSDSLYGVEPMSYYFKNLILNFNVVAPLGFLAMPILFLLRQRRPTELTLSVHIWVVLASVVPWLAVTFFRPHKEERFLFPIYPVLCFGAALVVFKVVEYLVPHDADGGPMNENTRETAVSSVPAASIAKPFDTNFLRNRRVYYGLALIPFVLVSLSRTAALCKYYNAPHLTYILLAGDIAQMGRNELLETNQNGTATSNSLLVCTCGEWYRYPGAAYFPSIVGDVPTRVQLGFLPSSFKGQLPQPFVKRFGSRPESVALQQPFNDRNEGNEERFVELHQCTYVVDIHGSECLAGEAMSNPSTWKIVAQAPMLDAGSTSSIHRILYMPYLHEKAQMRGSVRYYLYTLYRRRLVGAQVKEETAPDWK
jgi:alpha-1,2-mannosyltransferase